MIKKTSKTKKFFKDLDIFGQPIPLYFEGQPLYTTTFGGIITMIIISIIITLVIVMTNGLLSRTNYTTSTERDFKLNPGLLDLSKNFMFSIGIQDPTITLNNSIFSYSVSYYTSANLGGSRTQTSEISIPLHPCNPIDYLDFKKEFDQYYLNYTMCPDLTGITIQGQPYSPLYTYVKLNVSKCINGTNSGVICASDDYINEYFAQNQMKRIVLYFINSVADFDNYLNPFENKFIDELTWIISPDSKLRISTDLFFETNIINTLDNVAGIGQGWNISAIDYQGYKIDNVFMPDIVKYSQYLEIFIKSNAHYICTVRKFETFPQMISIIAGIWNILYLFLGQIAMRYNNALFKIDLANVLYDFDTVASGASDLTDEMEGDNDDENKGKYGLKKKPIPTNAIEIKEQKFITTDINKSPFKERRSLMDESKSDMLNNMDFLNKFNALRSKRRILKYSAKDIWTTIFRCCSTKTLKNKNLLLHKANTKLASDIDIRIILKKFKEVNEIKNTIFDENQLAIFNFVPQELIALDHDGESDQIKKIHLIQQKKYLRNQLKNLCCKKEEYFFRQIAYDTCKSRTDTISQNLIEKLDREAKEIFELLIQKKTEGTLNNLNTLGGQSVLQTNQLFNKNSLPSFECNPRENSESIIFGSPIQEYRKIEYVKRGDNVVLITNKQNHHVVIRDSNIPQEENIVYAPLNHNKTTPNQDVKLLSKKNLAPIIESSFGTEPSKQDNRIISNNEEDKDDNHAFLDDLATFKKVYNKTENLNTEDNDISYFGVSKPSRMPRNMPNRIKDNISVVERYSYRKSQSLKKRPLDDVIKKEDWKIINDRLKKFEMQNIKNQKSTNKKVIMTNYNDSYQKRRKSKQ